MKVAKQKPSPKVIQKKPLAKAVSAKPAAGRPKPALAVKKAGESVSQSSVPPVIAGKNVTKNNEPARNAKPRPKVAAEEPPAIRPIPSMKPQGKNGQSNKPIPID